MKLEKHELIIKQKDKEKRKHLDRIASKLLQLDEKAEKMRKYNLRNNPLDYL